MLMIGSKDLSAGLAYHVYDPDVIGITESWTTEHHLQSELQLEGYTCYRRYRMMYERSKSGGVFTLYEQQSFA